MSLGTLLHLTILRCLGASVIAELVSELLRAAIFVQIKASPAGRLPARPATSSRSRSASCPEFLLALAARAEPHAPVLVCVC